MSVNSRDMRSVMLWHYGSGFDVQGLGNDSVGVRDGSIQVWGSGELGCISGSGLGLFTDTESSSCRLVTSSQHRLLV